MQANKLLVPVLVTGIIGFSLLSSGTVQAAETTSTTSAKTTMFTTLVERIASTFGLDKAKVQTVVDQVQKEHQATRQAEMKAKNEERLTKLVSEGKITEAQKQAIIAKHTEMQANFNKDDMKNMTEEQRKVAMKQKKTEIDAWAKAQGIDAKYLMMGGHGRREGHF